MYKRQVVSTEEAENTDSQIALLSQFSAERNKNEVIQVLNELFDTTKIPLITDLQEDEIKLITAILMIADMKKLDVWEKGVNIYMKLLLSKRRQSRSEVIDAVKGFQERNARGLSKLIPQGWRGQG